MDIRVEYSEEALWGNVDPDADGYNKMASEKQFEQMIVDAFYEECPEAGVTVVKGSFDRVVVTGPARKLKETFLAQCWLEAVVDKVWNGDWQVAS